MGRQKGVTLDLLDLFHLHQAVAATAQGIDAVGRTIGTIGLDRNNSISGLLLRRIFKALKMPVTNSNLCLVKNSYRFVYEQLFIFLDLLGDLVQRFIGRLLGQLQDAAIRLDTTGWVVVMAIVLVCGWFFLRGSHIQGA